MNWATVNWARVVVAVVVAVVVTLAGCVSPALEPDPFGSSLIQPAPSLSRVLETARDVIGSERTLALRELLNRNVPEGAPMANLPGFDSRRAEIQAVWRWLMFIRGVHDARAQLKTMALRDRTMALASNAPFPLEPRAVLEHRAEIWWAARAAKLPPEVLAAIVDDEQSGANLMLGLSGALRALADGLALTEARLTGRSSLSGGFSMTLGIAQMSWRDAMGQRARLDAMNARFEPRVPTSELEMRASLERPDANLMLTASRLRGYLNASLHRPSLDVRAFPSGWAALEGPLWHNRPDLARARQVNAYAFHAFFKACLYAVLLEDKRVED